MRRFFYLTGIVFILICFSRPLMAAQLTETEQGQIMQAINAKGYKDAIVQFNLRIAVPEIQGLDPVDLWGTLIKHQGDGKYPTIVISTPYRRELCIMQGLTLFPHGYNILAVDTRGTGTAEGEWISFGPEEHTDVAFVIDSWIPSHEWSDGKVGLLGGSYMAIAQMMAAGQIEVDEQTGEPVHLKAMFPMATMSDAYRDIVWHGGNLDMAFIPMWMGVVDGLALLPSTLWLGGENADIDGTWEDPETDVLKEAGQNWMASWNQIPTHLAWFTDSGKLVDGPFYDERSPMIYWPDKNPAGRTCFGSDKIFPARLPVFTMGGWFDIFTRGTLNNYQYALKNHDGEDKALVMGPWYHIEAASGLGVTALSMLTNEVQARWFDWKIKGIEDPFMVEFPVLIYVMGKDQWRLEKEWPLPSSRTEKKALYLSKRKAPVNWMDWFSFFNSRKNYRLVEETATRDFKNNNPLLIHNPAELHGVTSRSTQRWLAGGISMISQFTKFFSNANIDYLMPWEDERLDEIACLTFTTDKLDEDVEITGPLTLTFWAKSTFKQPVSHAYIDKIETNVYDTMIQIPLNDDNSFIELLMDQKEVQWVIELNDVYPYGRAKNITSGWLRSSHRPYDPDESPNAKEHAIDPEYTPFDPFYGRPDREPKLIKDGELYQYVVELWPTSNMFKKGHRIRMSISASDFPHLLPVMVPSENTIVIDKNHPAKIEFDQVNTDNEGETWKWVDDMPEYENVSQYLTDHSN
ncbi:MAG: CocE/NonD family hydrolase [Proteobacteria bacterium]|nr:CocE/NonD family hydrolase [Pseudomonadota bacterium]